MGMALYGAQQVQAAKLPGRYLAGYTVRHLRFIHLHIPPLKLISLHLTLPRVSNSDE